MFTWFFSTCSKPRFPSIDIPNEYVCSITQEIMHDPVVTEKGHTYERTAIQAWLSAHDTDPITGIILTHKMLCPNFALKSLIDHFYDTHKHHPNLIPRYIPPEVSTEEQPHHENTPVTIRYFEESSSDEESEEETIHRTSCTIS